KRTITSALYLFTFMLSITPVTIKPVKTHLHRLPIMLSFTSFVFISLTVLMIILFQKPLIPLLSAPFEGRQYDREKFAICIPIIVLEKPFPTKILVPFVILFSCGTNRYAV